MTEHFLYRAKVGSVFEEMCRERVTKRVRAGLYLHAGVDDGTLDDTADAA